MEEIETSDNTTSDVDSLVEGIETPSHDIPMSAPPKEAPPAPQEYSFKAGGQEIKAPVDKILKWAQMGYEAPNRLGELNTKLQEYEGKIKGYTELDQKLSQYQEVDNYIKQNPQWWAQVQEQYSQAKQQQLANDPVAQKLQQYEDKFKQYDQLIESQRQERISQQRQQEDSRLREDIESIRKQYSNLDFSSPDESGKSLEYKVLEHANANGIPNFKAAFRDFYHEELIKMAQEKGKEAVAKDIQKKTKLGLLGESSAPKKQMSAVQNVRSKSYDAILNEALDEIKRGVI